MMSSILYFTFLLATGTYAARPYINEPDIEADRAFGDLNNGTTLPNLTSVVALHDFQYIARHYMEDTSYMMYSHGAGGEWSYRNNLEAFSRFRFRPRSMTDPTNIVDTLSTTILGHKFSAPFFISPCAWAGQAHEGGELNLVRAAAKENILYIPSDVTSKSKSEIAAERQVSGGPVLFQQTYLQGNDTAVREYIKNAEDSGISAFVLTIDASASGNRQRTYHYDVGVQPRTEFKSITWDFYDRMRNMTKLPIIAKGVQSVETARQAVEMRVPAIYISNHGGRQLDFSPSPLEVALEIHQKAPEIFQQVEVYADSGIRYGTDALKLLSLGVRAVGMGRPFMFSNVFGEEGVEHAIKIMKRELAIDAANLGLDDVKKIDSTYVEWMPNHWFG